MTFCQFIERLFRCHHPRERANQIIFRARNNTNGRNAMNVKFVVGSKGVTVQAQGFNATSGKNDPLFGVPVWTLSDPSKMNMAVAADGMSASFTDNGSASGSLSVHVTGEGDPTAGVDPVAGDFTIEADPEEATSIVFAATPNS